MKKREKYVVQLKGRGRWTNTVWANPDEHTEWDSPVIPVCKTKAIAAIKRAKCYYKDCEYRIQSVTV